MVEGGKSSGAKGVDGLNRTRGVGAGRYGVAVSEAGAGQASYGRKGRSLHTDQLSQFPDAGGMWELPC